MIAPTFGKGEEMMITAGPISLARPGWGLEAGTVTSLMANDSGGHPEVLAAQLLYGAAVAGVRVLMLLPYERDRDEVWRSMVELATDKTPRSVGENLGNLPLRVLTHGSGWNETDGAQLVYTPELSSRQARLFGERQIPPILVVGQEIEGKLPPQIRSTVIQVGGDALVFEGEGFEVSVVYDHGGPMYRPA